MSSVECSNIAKNSNLSLSNLNQNRQFLGSTKYPTGVCKECKINYVDRLGLDIFVICNCKCHTKEKENGIIQKIPNKNTGCLKHKMTGEI